MATDIINKYISETYSRLLDNCIFLCSKVYFMHGLEYDLLNDSLADFPDRVERDDNFREKVEGMLSRKNKNNEFSELDNYILSIIKMNVYSKTARFRQKYGLEVQEPGTYIDVDFQRLNIIDERDDNLEREQELQEKERRFKEACDIYGLSQRAQDIFRWKFIDRNPLSDYPYNGNKRKVYDIYNKTLQLVKDKIAGSLLL